jgi:mono/diheme cytochrome c family protein
MKPLWLLPLLGVSLGVCTGLRADVESAVDTDAGRDLAREVREVFEAKCANCHGPGLVKPRGRFGYVLDLQRLADNPEMVIPLRPDESELWVLVRREEMPPPDSPRGPLTDAQKQIIREWIAAGAPAKSSAAATLLPADQPEQSRPVEVDSGARLIRWLGKFHLLLLHFPIALVVVAGIGEAKSMWQRNRIRPEPVRFCLWLAALAVIPTVVLGWLFAAGGNGVGAPRLLAAHRWLGTTAAVWLTITATCAEWDARRQARSRVVQVLIFAGVIITAVTAHLGGLLAHGNDFFDY